ncbi:MAG: hypothetical protein HY554_14325 [Elusimicrobia bacterium]|nr:hypothetical protein [Elusimicrobiota bacterium]
MRIKVSLGVFLAAAVAGTAIAGGSGSSGGKGGGGGGGTCPAPAPVPPPPPTPLQEAVLKAVTGILARKQPIDCRGGTQYWGGGFVECFKKDRVPAHQVDARIERATYPLMRALLRPDSKPAKAMLLTFSEFPEETRTYRQGELAYELEDLRAAVAQAINVIERAGTP